jgi:hypothetical protein
VLLALTLGFFYAELAGWVGNGFNLLVVPLLACAIGARLVARSWFVALGMAACAWCTGAPRPSAPRT